MNNLTMLGANIIDNDAMDVHTSGHARQDDIKLMLSLIKPKYYLPVHGERYMRVANGKIAQVMGIPEKNVFSIPNGGILEFSNRVITESKEKIDVGYIMVDGSSEGLSGSKVIAERQVMARDGVIVLTFKVDRKTKKLLAAPKMISKGFIYMEELQEVTKGVIAEAKRLYDSLCDRMDLGKTDKQTELVRALRADLSRYVDSKTDRIPMILPIIIEQ
jgi:ribonuclease J